uniref:Exosome protein n=1 Tax=Staphylothermus marinus TaxID=2280 RepID=A0A7J3PJK7_STAMA
MIRVSSVEYLVYCHATEDCSKVLEAVKKLLPPDMRDTVVFKQQKLRGYYGNPITVISLKIIENAEKIFDYLISRINDIDKAIISSTIDLRYDSRLRKLYLRFDKQEAYRGNVVLQDSDDVIKIIISFSNHYSKLNSVKEYLRNKGFIR